MLGGGGTATLEVPANGHLTPFSAYKAFSILIDVPIVYHLLDTNTTVKYPYYWVTVSGWQSYCLGVPETVRRGASRSVSGCPFQYLGVALPVGRGALLI